MVALPSFTPYRAVLGEPAFGRFWLGFTFSILGDSMTRVALTWHVYESTRSPAPLGWLTLCYTAPVALSGLLAATRGELVERSPAGVRVTVVATGGFALQPWLDDVPGIDRVEPELTLRGVRYAYESIAAREEVRA